MGSSRVGSNPARSDYFDNSVFVTNRRDIIQAHLTPTVRASKRTSPETLWQTLQQGESLVPSRIHVQRFLLRSVRALNTHSFPDRDSVTEDVNAGCLADSYYFIPCSRQER